MKNILNIFKIFILVIIVSNIFIPLRGEVSRFEITYRELYAEGKSFGETGPYEVIKGWLYYEVDPAHPGNKMVVDIEYAPLNSRGKIEFSSEFILMKPLNLNKGNHRLIYDVNNRGNLVLLGVMNDAPFSNLPIDERSAGNGFLMEQGYSLLWSGWNWDVKPGDGKLQTKLPVALKNGNTISQLIPAEIVCSFETKPVFNKPLAWGGSLCYPPADPDNRSEDVLTVRLKPKGKRVRIHPDLWAYGRLNGEHFITDPSWLHLRTKFKPGKIYELVYRVKNPKIVGLGLTAVRDTLSFFRKKKRDNFGQFNPLILKVNGKIIGPDPEKVFIFGVSQSGRFITHMIFQGFHVDLEGDMVFDGARIHVAGGGKGGFNFRFAQTTHHPSDLEGNYMPADFFPFNYAPQTDPMTGKNGDVLAAAKKSGKIPYIMITNNELEYWTRSASLIHTDVEAKHDTEIHPKVRIYVTVSAPHNNIKTRERRIYEHSLNPMNHYAVSRALMGALDKWVTEGKEPPASNYPRIDKGELISAEEHKKKFPAIPGMRHPGRNLNPPRVDYGPNFWRDWIMTIVPPKQGTSYVTKVPSFDRDGNSIGGVRLPELLVPLGTYQGWNVRHKKFGAPNYLGRFYGSFWPFALTEAERKNKNDPRESIEKRYPTQKHYVSKMKKAVLKLIKSGFLLKNDAELYISKAEKMAWPPQMTDKKPFWKLKSK